MIAIGDYTISEVYDGESIQGDTGATISTSTEQYYLSDYNNRLSGGSWGDTEPSSIPSGKYLWGRWKFTMTDGTTQYSDAVYRSTIQGIESKVNTLDNSITNKVWQTDINNSISSYDNSTGTAIRNRVTQTETNISGINTTISNMQTDIAGKADGSTVSQMQETLTEVEETAGNTATHFSNIVQTLGTNADGTSASGDVVHRMTDIESGYNGITQRVSTTETRLLGQYATSSTGASTQNKVATITPAVTGWELYTGATITVKFTNANTHATPNLNINNTGAKGIRTYSGGTLSEGEYKWKAGDVFTFTYNGTYWLMQDSMTRLRDNETIIQQTANNVLIKATENDTTAAQGGQHLIQSLINVAPDGITIDADKVNIEGATIFSSGRLSAESLSENMLLDTYAPSVTKVNAKYNRYFSDASNTSTTASFVSAGNEVLPDPNAKYFVRIKNTVAYNSSATDKGLKALTFYNSGDYVNGIGMVVGDTYRASCWVRQLEGGSNFTIGLGGFVNNVNFSDLSFVPTPEWQKYEKVFTLTDFKSTSTTVWSRLYFENLAGYGINGAGSGIGQIDMCGFKLERINAITASGRNLCLRSADYKGWGKNNGTTFDGNVITFPTVTTNTWRNAWVGNPLPYSTVRNQKITVTFKIKGTAGEILSPYFSFGLNSDSTRRLKYVDKYQPIYGTGEWQTVVLSMYVNDFAFVSGSGSPNYDSCYFEIQLGATGDTNGRNGFQLKEIMVALGSDPCAWGPAPEDGVTQEQRIYYRNNTRSAPSAPLTWITETSTLNQSWTTKRMQYDKTYPYLFTCIQRLNIGGAISNTTVLLDDTTTVIDGGNIITGSVTTNKLATDAIKSLDYGAPASGSQFSTKGTFFNLADQGEFRSKNFAIDKNGNAYFNGALTATSLTIAPGATFDGDIDQFKGASFNWNLLLGTATPVTWTVALNTSNYMVKDCYKTISPVPKLFAVNDLVTIAFDWETDATGGNFHVECGTVTPYGWGTVVSAEGGRSSTSNYVDISSSKQSGHFKVTFKIGTAQTGAADTLQWLRIRVDGADTSGKSFTISNAKAERGSNASDWSPAESEIHGTDGASFNWNLLLDTLKDAGESHTIYTITDFNFAESTVEGEKYTISAKITTSSEKTAVGFFHSGGTFQMSGWLPVTSTGLYKTTFTATSEMASQKGGKGHGFCRVYVSNNPNKSAQGSYALAGTAHVDWIKIEKGETASDWCTAESEIHGKDGLDGISASGLAIKVNYSSYTTANTGECYFHGYNDSNEEADVDGWVMWNGEKLTITKGMWINPNGAVPVNTPIFHVFRTSASPYHSDVWWDSSLLTWRGYAYTTDKVPGTKANWTWNEATDCILAVYITTGNEEISSAQLFTTPKKFSELPNPNDIHSIVDTSIDGIEIGGRNLLQGTSNPQISATYALPYYSIRSGGDGVGSIESIEDSPVAGVTRAFRITGNTTGNRDFVQLVEDFNALWTDGQWMFSCYARGVDASATALIRVYTANLAFQTSISVGTSWTRIEVPVKLNGSGAKTDDIKFQFGITGAGSIEYIAPMLERGTKASAWSYAPEDVDSSINGAKELANNALGNAATAQGTANNALKNAAIADGKAVSAQSTADEASGKADDALDKYGAISGIVDDYNNLRNYYLEFNPTPSGINGLIIGARNSDGSDNAFKTEITNSELAFRQGTDKVAWINTNEFFINHGTIQTGLRVGNFVIFDEDGALNIKYEPRSTNE